MVLSLVLSWILGLTWPYYSVFWSSHDFARIPQISLGFWPFLRRLLLPQCFYLIPPITVAFRSTHTSNTKPILECQALWVRSQSSDSWFDLWFFALCSAYSKLWFLFAHQAPKTVSQGDVSWLQDHKISNFLLALLTFCPFFPPASVGPCSFPGCCCGSLNFSAPNAPVFSWILGSAHILLERTISTIPVAFGRED